MNFSCVRANFQDKNSQKKRRFIEQSCIQFKKNFVSEDSANIQQKHTHSWQSISHLVPDITSCIALALRDYNQFILNPLKFLFRFRFVSFSTMQSNSLTTINMKSFAFVGWCRMSSIQQKTCFWLSNTQNTFVRRMNKKNITE